MDDLIPFLVFIVIALINFAKFLMERGAKEKTPPTEGEEPPKRRSSSLEDLFADLARKLDPNEKPVDLPDWPEGYEKPDYAAEQAAYEEFREEQENEEPQTASAEIIATPEPVHLEPAVKPDTVPVPSLKSTKASMPVMRSAFSSAAMPSMPMMKSNAAGSIHFSLKNPEELRKAILAKVVLDPPRAFDESFENTARR